MRYLFVGARIGRSWGNTLTERGVAYRSHYSTLTPAGAARRYGVTGAGPAGSAAPLPFRIRRSGDLRTQTWTEQSGTWTQPASVAPVAVAAAAPVTVAGSGWRVERHPESGRCRTRGRARPKVGFRRQERPRADYAHPLSTCCQAFALLSRSPPCVGRPFSSGYAGYVGYANGAC